MQIKSVGIDLGKTTFHLVVLGEAGKVLARKKFTRRQLLTYTANMPTSLIGLEACSVAHFLGRALRKQGHDVRLIAAQFVKPFVKKTVEDQIEGLSRELERISAGDGGCTRLRRIPGDWTNRGHGHRCCHRQRRSLSQGMRLCCLAWGRATAVFDRR